jgi:hypothetical protein
MRKDIWESMLDADMNVRYWSKLGRCYRNKDTAYKIFLAIMSSGTVASWKFWSNFQIGWEIWKILSGISAIMAIALPILNWPKMIESIVNVAQKWTQIKIDYEILWTELNRGKEQSVLMAEYKRVKRKEAIASQQETNLPHKNSVLDKCFKEVLRSKGLNNKQ